MDEDMPALKETLKDFPLNEFTLKSDGSGEPFLILGTVNEIKYKVGNSEFIHSFEMNTPILAFDNYLGIFLPCLITSEGIQDLYLTPAGIRFINDGRYSFNELIQLGMVTESDEKITDYINFNIKADTVPDRSVDEIQSPATDAKEEIVFTPESEFKKEVGVNPKKSVRKKTPRTKSTAKRSPRTKSKGK